MGKKLINYLELYARATGRESLFLYARENNKEDTLRCAGNFLCSLSVYEQRVPYRIRKKLIGFENSKKLAEKVIDKEIKEKEKRDRLQETLRKTLLQRCFN